MEKKGLEIYNSIRAFPFYRDIYKPNIFKPNYKSNSYFSNFKSGFSLIEILLVITIIGILSSSTYVAFNQFNKYQNLNTNFENLKNAISEAKSNASSQVTRTCTTAQVLVGYQIAFDASTNPNRYLLEEVCSLPNGTNKVSHVVKTNNLASGIYYDSSVGLPGPILFEVLTGNVPIADSVTITLTNGSQSKSVSVDSTGVISDVKN